MATQRDSISTTTITDTQQDETYGTPGNGDLAKAVNDALKNSTKNTPCMNQYGNYAGNRIYEFTSCISAGPSFPTTSAGSCQSKYGDIVNVGTEVTTTPSCCSTCTAPPLTLQSGSEKWKDTKTRSKVSCPQNIPYTAIYTLRAGQRPIVNGTLPQTKTYSGIVVGSAPTEKCVTDWIREQVFESQVCHDCYC